MKTGLVLEGGGLRGVFTLSLIHILQLIPAMPKAMKRCTWESCSAICVFS